MLGLCVRSGKTSRVLLHAEQKEAVRWHNSAQQQDKRNPGGGKAHGLGRKAAFYPKENWRGVRSQSD